MTNLTKRLVSTVATVILAALLLAACGGGGAANNQPVDVQVTLTEFKIDSSLTTFKVGVPYHFTVTNNGAVAHSFEIMPPTSPSSEPLSTEQVKQMALAEIGQDKLTPGATVSVDYTFTQAYPDGSLELACHVPGHYEAGMHSPIVVNQ